MTRLISMEDSRNQQFAVPQGPPRIEYSVILLTSSQLTAASEIRPIWRGGLPIRNGSTSRRLSVSLTRTVPGRGNARRDREDSRDATELIRDHQGAHTGSSTSRADLERTPQDQAWLHRAREAREEGEEGQTATRRVFDLS